MMKVQVVPVRMSETELVKLCTTLGFNTLHARSAGILVLEGDALDPEALAKLQGKVGPGVMFEDPSGSVFPNTVILWGTPEQQKQTIREYWQ